MTEQELSSISEYNRHSWLTGEMSRKLIDEVVRLRVLILGLKDNYDGTPCTHCCPHCPWCDNGMHEMADGVFVHGPECKAFTPDGRLK